MDWFSLAVGALCGALAVNQCYNWVVYRDGLKACPHEPAEELKVSNVGTENVLITHCVHCGEPLAGKWEQSWTEF